MSDQPSGAGGERRVASTQLLRDAVECVQRERTSLLAERAALEEFRDEARLVRPAREDDPTSSGDASVDVVSVSDDGSAAVLAAYRESVMATPDYEETYDESFKSSLERELSPSLARTLLGGEPLTQRRKRDLLLETTDAIENRAALVGVLDAELASLDTAIAELEDFETALEVLPSCSPRRLTFDDLQRTWERYEELKAQCERLFDARQRHLARVNGAVHDSRTEHPLSEYLYADLDVTYPVLAVGIDLYARIDRHREAGTAGGASGAPCRT